MKRLIQRGDWDVDTVIPVIAVLGSTVSCRFGKSCLTFSFETKNETDAFLILVYVQIQLPEVNRDYSPEHT